MSVNLSTPAEDLISKWFTHLLHIPCLRTIFLYSNCNKICATGMKKMILEKSYMLYTWENKFQFINDSLKCVSPLDPSEVTWPYWSNVRHTKAVHSIWDLAHFQMCHISGIYESALMSNAQHCIFQNIWLPPVPVMATTQSTEHLQNPLTF